MKCVRRCVRLSRRPPLIRQIDSEDFALQIELTILFCIKRVKAGSLTGKPSRTMPFRLLFSCGVMHQHEIYILFDGFLMPDASGTVTSPQFKERAVCLME